MSGVLGTMVSGLAGEEFCAWELRQSGQAVGGRFPMSAEGWDSGVSGSGE